MNLPYVQLVEYDRPNAEVADVPKEKRIMFINAVASRLLLVIPPESYNQTASTQSRR